MQDFGVSNALHLFLNENLGVIESIGGEKNLGTCQVTEISGSPALPLKKPMAKTSLYESATPINEKDHQQGGQSKRYSLRDLVMPT
ncbi:hypothetical protein QTV49_004607 [Vibrio vulnificus]|nr:hypothetical protein [Vibrio vulnificus]